MQIINLTCPNCGASLQVGNNDKKITCNYCGNHFLIEDDVQHIQYNNAEETGYLFEKGRQRAQAESSIKEIRQQVEPTPNQPQKKNLIWLWVLGWIFIFPVPLTILMVRNKKLDKKLRYVIIAVAWIVYFIIAFCGVNSREKDNSLNNDSNLESNNSYGIESESSEAESSEAESSEAESSESETISQEDLIETIVKGYNSKSDNQMIFVEDFVVQDKESGHYRTEFRLNAFKNATGKSYAIEEHTIDIVSTKGSLGSTEVRIYADMIPLDLCIDLVSHASSLLDNTITDETISETIDYLTENEEANGYYYGKLGLTLFKKRPNQFNLMIKTH